MRPDRIASLPRTAVAVDTETWLIEPGVLAPPLVCFSFAGPGGREWVRGGDEADKQRGLDEFLDLLRDDRVVLVFANGAFDLLVIATYARRARALDIMPDIYAALAAGRVWDVQIAEQLRAIAEGTLGKDPFTLAELKQDGMDPGAAARAVEGARAWAGDHPDRQAYAAQVAAVVAGLSARASRKAGYSLAQVLRILTGDEGAKEHDDYRLRFRELDGIPWREWPESARLYVLDDARNTRRCAMIQGGHDPGLRWAAYPGKPGDELALRREEHQNLHDLASQVGTAWALHLGGNRGFATCQRTVDEVEAAALEAQARDLPKFLAAGLVRPDGTADQLALARLVARAYAGEAGARCTACEDGSVPCPVCGASGRVPGARPGKTKQCPDCDGGYLKCEACRGTGYDLDRCPSIPRTDTGGVAGSRDALNESGDDLLISRAEFTEGKVLTLYVPLFRRPVVQPRSNVLVTTGRISVGDGLHSLPRNGRVRECVVARPGYVISSVDLESAEMVSHAQNLLWVVGHSALADALNSGTKPHNLLGARMTGVSYEDFNARIKAKEQFYVDSRVAAKWGDFGFPGGSGAWKLITICRAQGPDTPAPGGPVLVELEDGREVPGHRGLRFCVLMDGAERCGVEKFTEWTFGNGYTRTGAPTCRRCMECVLRLRKFFLETWPEHDGDGGYFATIKRWLEEGAPVPNYARRLLGDYVSPGQVVQHRSARVRGGLGDGDSFPAACNTLFQGLVADAEKWAVRKISRECYDRTVRVATTESPGQRQSAYEGGPSPLYGSHFIMLAHDEPLCEHPEGEAHDAATRVAEIQVEGLRLYCPDLAAACKADPAIMRVLHKAAATVRDENGRLVCWEPKRRSAA